MLIDVINDWKPFFDNQSCQKYFIDLMQFLSEREQVADIVPKTSLMFKAFKLTQLQDIKVVIVGQDPYPNPKQANGLAFGVPYGVALPKTLINIVNEVETCLNEPEWNEKENKIVRPELTVLNRSNMTLEGWAKQGVLMLNSCLTTEDGAIYSHRNKGWELFTDQVMLAISARMKPTVYMLWGNAAKEKVHHIMVIGSGVKNCVVLESTHPSTLSFNSGELSLRFQGCRHFNKANQFLAKKGLTRIDWSKTGG
jgi:uracil-DNA glycosylase